MTTNGTDKPRVLIADDDQDVRELFLAVLSCDLPDCPVDAVVNGAEAVEAFRSSHHGVIVIDVNMPVMGGEEAYENIRKICDGEKLNMPCFLFCTGDDAPPPIKKIVAENPRNCTLRKPVDPDDLVQVLKNRLGL